MTAIGGHGEAGYQELQVLGVLHTRTNKGFRIRGLDRSGYLLEGLLTFFRGDHDLLDHADLRVVLAGCRAIRLGGKRQKKTGGQPERQHFDFFRLHRLSHPQ